jgi:hypothetical protein
MKDLNGNQLEIANGSYIYFRSAEGKEIRLQWHELNEVGHDRINHVVGRAIDDLGKVGGWLAWMISFFEKAEAYGTEEGAKTADRNWRKERLRVVQ